MAQVSTIRGRVKSAIKSDKKRLDENGDDFQEEIWWHEEAIEDIHLNRQMKERYAGWVFWYFSLYSLFSAVVVLLNGFNIWGFYLEKVPFSVLIGTLAANVIGLVAIILKGLFR